MIPMKPSTKLDLLEKLTIAVIVIVLTIFSLALNIP